MNSNGSNVQANSIEELDVPAILQTLQEALPDFLATKRWCRAGSTIQAARPHKALVLGDRPVLLYVQVDVEHLDARTNSYHLPVGIRDGADPFQPADPGHIIGPLPGGRVMYDALEDPVLVARLLAFVARGSGPGLLVERHEPFEVGPKAAEVRSRDSSNTCVWWGPGLLLKWFRRARRERVAEATIPALIKHQFPNVPRVLGALHLPGEGTVAVVQEVVKGARSASAVIDADAAQVVAGRAGRSGVSLAPLGRSLAELHLVLAGLGLVSGCALHVREWAQELEAELEAALRSEHPAVAVVRQHLDACNIVLAALQRVREPGAVCRIHGDCHIGQVLERDGEWIFLDFEAEPIGRRRPFSTSPLMDVASLARSIAYTAEGALRITGTVRDPAAQARSREWVQEQRQALLDGYSSRLRGTRLLPAREEFRVLLRAFELRRALYELRYELDYRPEQAGIPLAGVLRILQGVA